MIILHAYKNRLEVLKGETLTSGASKVFTCEFEFSGDWEGLTKTVLFRAGDTQIPVIPEADNTCQIPPEVLMGPGLHCLTGVQGANADGDTILPTIWADLGEVEWGATTGELPPPTEDIYTQILSAAQEVQQVAQSVRDDADAGKFDGAPGPQGPPGEGIPEITEEDNGKFLGAEDGVAKWLPVEGGGGSSDLPVVFESTKTDLTTPDSQVISSFFAAPEAPTPKQEDVFVITTIVEDVNYEKSAYQYNGTDWIALTGNVDADKVIMWENLTLAGDYTQIGNWTKTQNGTATIDSMGMSVADLIKNMTTKTLQPTITAQPAISGFNLSGAGAVEAGTQIAQANYTGATLTSGSYQYGPATGVAATGWTVTRVTNSGSEQILSLSESALPAGSDDNAGAAFVIGDMGGGENVFSSLRYTANVTHTGGVTAFDNLRGESDPPVAIAAGSKSRQTAAYTPYRNYFYGATAEKPTVDSSYIRSLTKSNRAYAAGTITLNVAAGSQRVVIACVATATGVTQVINETALSADVTSTFTKSTVAVEGANGYAAADYNVWIFEPAVPYENAAVLKVTLG